MSGYYDYDPTQVLDRPLVLTGYFADLTRVLGFRLASLTGLPVNSLDRLVEHRSGKSVWDLIWSEGEARYRTLEREMLERSLREQPFGIVTLGDGTLLDDDNRRQVADQAHLVVFDLDLANFYWRLKGTKEATQEFWHPLFAGPVDSFEQVKPFYQPRSLSFAAANHRIDIPGRTEGRILDALMTHLDEL